MKFYKMGIPLIASGVLFAAGCEVDQTQQAKLPDVDVRADAGKLPKFEVTQTEEGRLPDVDVDVKGGQLPKYDIDGPDVKIGEKQVSVDVPDVDVDVHTEKKTFTVPTIDVELPSDADDVDDYPQ